MHRARLRDLLLFALVGCGRTPLDPAGGTGGTGGAVSSGVPCAGQLVCRDDEICCDGSTPDCDITRLPAGDTADPGELSFAVDSVTVSDTVTGLTWQRELMTPRPGCGGSNGACTWGEAQDYCASLTLNGFSGWRLPGRMELLTIVDFTKVSPAVNARAFPILPSNTTQWTASPDILKPGWAWEIFPASGRTRPDDGNVQKIVRCVRGARCVPKVRFAVLEGGLVQDKVTGLVWQPRISDSDMPWTQAQSYCSTLAPGFRLPSVRELASLMDPTMLSPGAIADMTVFANIPESPDTGFWSSTPNATPEGAAWMVYLGGDAGTAAQEQDHLFRAWCVR